MFESVNPATGEVVGTHPVHTPGELEARLGASHGAAARWACTPVEQRAGLLVRIADLLERDREEHALLMTHEMGKPIGQARGEVDKCAWACRHYAAQAPDLLAPRPVATEAAYSAVHLDPVGPVLAIMPWNFPYWQVLRFAAPTLVAGNTVLLKHAENVMGVATRIEALLREAGAPDGVFTNLAIERPTVADVIADRRVRGVTLTGSVGAGRAVAEAAGRHGKKSVLELGGSDPFVVLDDADLEGAAEVGVQSRLLNAGQSCIAAKRVVVVDAVADALVDALAERMAGQRVGDPRDEATDVGPMARADLRGQLAGQVDRSIAAGATLVMGGRTVAGPGFYYEPTLLVGVEPGHAVAEEETFGPALAVLRVPNEDAAVGLANASTYGLGASLWTQDLERATRLVPQLHAGVVAVNDLVRSDPRLPFGGVKDSGYGRELGEAGALEFVNVRAVTMRAPGRR